jgi:hypothetical protein
MGGLGLISHHHKPPQSDGSECQDGGRWGAGAPFLCSTVNLMSLVGDSLTCQTFLCSTVNQHTAGADVRIPDGDPSYILGITT